MKVNRVRRASTQKKAAFAKGIEAFRIALGSPSLAWAQQRIASTMPADGEAVLRRLLDDDDVPARFATIPRSEWGHVLQAAIIGEQMARQVEAEMAARSRTASDDREAAEGARRALQTIKKFLGRDATPMFSGDIAEELVKLLDGVSEAIVSVVLTPRF